MTDRILEAPEPIQLRHRDDSARRKVFLVGEHVPEEWLLPGEDGTPVHTETVSDAGSEDWDALDASEDAVPVEVTTAAAEDAVVTEIITSDPSEGIDLSGSVTAVEAQILALPEVERLAAAEWVIKQESLSRAPRQTLIAAMKKIA